MTIHQRYTHRRTDGRHARSISATALHRMKSRRKLTDHEGRRKLIPVSRVAAIRRNPNGQMSSVRDTMLVARRIAPFLATE